VDDAVN